MESVDSMRYKDLQSKKGLDPIEIEYIRAIDHTHDSDEALELTIGLRQYREQYKERVQ